MNHEHACAHVHEHIERVQCLIMMLIDNDNGHVHVHVPCCAPCMKQTIIVFCDANFNMLYVTTLYMLYNVCKYTRLCLLFRPVQHYGQRMLL